MADTFTTNYNLTKPQVGGDPDTWGNLLNANFDAIDSQMYTNNQLAAAALPKTGGTLTGGLSIAPPGAGGTLVIRSAASGQAMAVAGSMGAAIRWVARLGDGSAESGSNAGSNFSLLRYNDAGTFIDTPLSISRATGLASFAVRPSFASATPWDSANLNPALYALLTGAAFSGAISATTVTGSTSVTSSGNVIANSKFVSSGNAAILATAGAGTVYLRPNGENSTTGQVTVDSTGIAMGVDFKATSDERLKTDIRRLRRGLDELKRMLPIEYVKGGLEEIGFIAQEAREVIPEAVSVNPEGFLTLSYGQVVALVASAVLDLDARMALAGI